VTLRRPLAAAGALLLACALPAAADEAVVNGFRMHYEEHGRGDPVVFIHGFTLDARMWDAQRGFAKKHRMIVADMRFHGRSEAPESSTFTLDEAVGDILALLDHLHLRQAHLVGLSMGAGYALETALRYPERVLSLTLASPSIQGFKIPTEAMTAFMNGVHAYPKEGADGFRRAWLEDPLFAPASARPELRQQVAAMVQAYNVDALYRVMSNRKPEKQPSQLDRLGEVKVPTLVVIGGLDAPHMIQAGEESARRIPGARKVVYAGSGHLVNMEEPEKFNRDVEAFLNAHPTR
jgi:pimeloyl-ACP methyl ester carboxylesterase